MVNRKCQRCGLIRDSSQMWYNKQRKGYVCEPTNSNFRQECSRRMRDNFDLYKTKNDNSIKEDLA